MKPKTPNLYRIQRLGPGHFQLPGKTHYARIRAQRNPALLKYEVNLIHRQHGEVNAYRLFATTLSEARDYAQEMIEKLDLEAGSK